MKFTLGQFKKSIYTFVDGNLLRRSNILKVTILPLDKTYLFEHRNVVFDLDEVFYVWFEQ